MIIDSEDLQMGVETVTCIATWGAGTTEPLTFAWKPEFMPPAIGSQGASKVDCVTVWFVAKKLNTTISPTAATMESGV